MTSPRDRRILLPCLLGFFCALAARAMAEPAAELRTIWQIGESDNRADEFALAPKGYLDFLQHDFGCVGPGNVGVLGDLANLI